MKYFAIVGHRAMSKGKLPLNDLAGGAGRMDVLIRAIMSSLLLSHGIREDSVIRLHLQGGPGPARRIEIRGRSVKGIHAEERSIAGVLSKIISTPLPPVGVWTEWSPGIFQSGGTIETTIREWSDRTQIILNADSPRLWVDSQMTNTAPARAHDEDIAFILSDDQPLNLDHTETMIERSLGDTWLQGHLAIAIVHFLFDEGFVLNV